MTNYRTLSPEQTQAVSGGGGGKISLEGSCAL